MKKTHIAPECCVYCEHYDGKWCMANDIPPIPAGGECPHFKEFQIHDMTVNITGGEMSPHEQAAYLRKALKQYGENLKGISFELDGDMVNITYDLEKPPFERIRRITGYLVPNLDKWNDGKRAEERDRVKHDISEGSL